jgi:cobalt/nickel transport protein
MKHNKTPAQFQVSQNKQKWIGFLVIVLMIGVLSPFASSHPDGLERVAQDYDFIDNATNVFTVSPLLDYEARFIHWHFGSIVFAGWLGIGIVFIALTSILYLLHKRGEKHGRISER